MTNPDPNLDQLCVNTIRMLSADMVEKSNSGHPGMPMGAAPMAYALWDRFLRHNPVDPAWPGRDRFVLSAGHGSALLYSLLHLTGYDLSLDDIKQFRQWGSKTAGHPEYGLCPGVEATTGPLGQGFAMGVGMALAQRFLSQRFNRPDFPLFEHFIYAIVSDGDLMEGVSSEAASLAGTLGLGRIVYLYDDNHISIEGSTDLAFTEDRVARFKAYGWHVQEVADGNDLEAIAGAITKARQDLERPSLIAVRTHIGYGCIKQDQASAHGEPLGAEALESARECFSWPAEAFHIPAEAAAHLAQARERGAQDQARWDALLADYAKQFGAEAALLKEMLAGKLPQDWRSALPTFSPEDGPLATRAASGKVLGALAEKITNLVGGSADLAPSNKTMLAGVADMRPNQEPGGRNIHFGVREHAMGAMLNGMALHGGVIPYGGTFLVFADYMRPAIRLAALMQTRALFIFTHDSLGVGEDGPTHQPVEHLASLRAIPGLRVLRPADANETALAWATALDSPGPSVLIFTRQKLPILDTHKYPLAQGAPRGAYVLSDCQGDPQILLLATGSEVALAMETQKALLEKNVAARVISMPCWETFADQPQDYQDQVLPPNVKARLAMEAGISMGWRKWTGDNGDIISVEKFGHSAPGGTVLKNYGFNLDNAVKKAMALV